MVTSSVDQSASLDTIEEVGLESGIEAEGAAPGAEERQLAPAVDYAKALAEANAQIVKLQENLTAQRSRPQRPNQRDSALMARIDALASEVAAMRKGQAVVAKGVVSGETEAL